MPGGPVIITPRKLFMPFLPGFLKLAFRLPDLGSVICRRCCVITQGTNQSLSHCRSFSTCPLFPQISFKVCGAYRSVHSCVVGSTVLPLLSESDPQHHAEVKPSTHPRTTLDPEALAAFSRASISFALSRMAFSSFSLFFFSFSLRPLPSPGPFRVATNLRKSSSDNVFKLCFCIAAILLAPALSPSTT